MSDTAAGLLSIAVVVGLLAVAYVPLGDYMARVFTSRGHLSVERLVYRLTGVSADAEQNAKSYAVSVIAFSLVGIVVLMAILIGQAALPMSRDMSGMPFWMSFNTAISFVTNTNWQSYAGESTLGFTAQMAGRYHLERFLVSEGLPTKYLGATRPVLAALFSDRQNFT